MRLEEKADFFIELFNNSKISRVPIRALLHLVSYQSILEVVGKFDFLNLYADSSVMLIMLAFEEDKLKDKKEEGKE